MWNFTASVHFSVEHLTATFNWLVHPTLQGVLETGSHLAIIKFPVVM